MSDAASRLKAKLQTGTSFGILQCYPGVNAFSAQAVAYLGNAAALCDSADGLPDFAVYGAVFGIRHGLELWLKGIVHAERLDAAWFAAHAASSNLASVAVAAKLTMKMERLSLRRALCVLRNVLEDHVSYPDCHRRRMEEVWASRSVEFIRDANVAARWHLAATWAPCCVTHSIDDLWRDAKCRVIASHYCAEARAAEAGLVQPASIEQIGAACELFDLLDPDGDAFRYPSSTSGGWHSEQLALNLGQLGRLAEELEATVHAFDAVDD